MYVFFIKVDAPELLMSSHHTSGRVQDKDQQQRGKREASCLRSQLLLPSFSSFGKIYTQLHCRQPVIFTRLQTTFKAILSKSNHEIERTSAFFSYFCDRLALEPASVEEQLFAHLRRQNCIYVEATHSQYAQDVFGKSRQVIGVVSSKLLQVLHLPNSPPSKSEIVDTALHMLCVPTAVWERPRAGCGWEVIQETFADKVPLCFLVDTPSKFIGNSRWIEVDKAKCLVLSKDSVATLTAQEFYFMIIEHDAIRPMVSEKFWTLLTYSHASSEGDESDDDTPLRLLFSPQVCEVGGQIPAAPLVTPPPRISHPESTSRACHGFPAAPCSTPSTGRKRTRFMCDAGGDDNLRDVLSAEGRKLQVRVLKTRFDSVRVSVDAGVRFEACVDAQFT